jgi:hypothetical protein
MNAPRLMITGPHRYPDLARLWHRFVYKDVAPAFRSLGWEVKVVIFRDANQEHFAQSDFPETAFLDPGPGARDFVEFYDAVLQTDYDFVFFLDADVFILDAVWAASCTRYFDDPDVAALSYLRRGKLPGVYALLCRARDFRALPGGTMMASYEDLQKWPDSVNRGPGERAAPMLEMAGKRIVDLNEQAPQRISDFHGTTVIRVSRETFAGVIGEEAFEAFIAQSRYFAMGAYDNVLLGWLYRSIFDAPFAPGVDGRELGGSLTVETLRRVLARIERAELRAALTEYFARSDRSAERLARHLGIREPLLTLVPDCWRTANAG